MAIVPLLARTILIVALFAGLSSAAIAQPNIVFILADDLGWRDLGCYGTTFYETPHLDALAESGMRFTQAYAACPVCSPTRASIMTGKYPARMNTTDWFGAPQPDTVERHHTRDEPLLPARYVDRLPLDEITLAEALKAESYATFFAGKWHLGDEGYFPEDQGFDVNAGGHHRGSPPGGYFAPYKNPKLPNGPDGEHLPIRLAKETRSFIASHADEPFFAFLSFYSVHTPLQTTDALRTKYERKRDELGLEAEWGEEGERKVRLAQCHPTYAGMVQAMDTAVGMVLDALEEAGVADNTAIFFTSDNGGLSTSEGHPTSNLPLRAGKGWLYEGGIREPLLIRWPGVTRTGSVCDTPVISTDFSPTILDMLGLTPPDANIDGVSLAPLLRESGSLEERALFWHYPHYGNQGGSPSAAIRSGDYKLIQFYEDGREALYNLTQDIGESKDISADHPDIRSRLSAALRSWQDDVGARFPSPNPAAR